MQELVLTQPGKLIEANAEREAEKAGARRELELLLADNAPLAYRVALGVLRNPAEAEDVAQESLLRAYRRYHLLRDAQRFRSWLVRIAFRLALDRSRSLRSRTERETRWAKPELRPPQQSAEQVAALNAIQERLGLAMDELPDSPDDSNVIDRNPGTFDRTNRRQFRRFVWHCEVAFVQGAEAVDGEVAMNCDRVRQKLMDALAAGDAEFSAEVDSHVRGCNECRSFYETEAQLLRSIEESLAEIVNQAAPTSLLPRVRQHLEDAGPDLNWRQKFLPAMAVFAIAALLAIGLLRHKDAPAIETVASVQLKTEKGVSEKPSADIVKPMASSLPSAGKRSGYISKSQHSAASKPRDFPEIIVSPDELHGMKLLSSTIYHEPAIGKAILHPIVAPMPEVKPIATEEIVDLR